MNTHQYLSRQLINLYSINVILELEHISNTS